MEQNTSTNYVIIKGMTTYSSDLESVVQFYKDNGFFPIQQTNQSITLTKPANKMSAGSAVLWILLLHLIGIIVVVYNILNNKDLMVCLRILPNGQIEASGDIIYQQTITVSSFTTREKIFIVSIIVFLIGCLVGTVLWSKTNTREIAVNQTKNTDSTLQPNEKESQIIFDKYFSIVPTTYQSIPFEINKTSKIIGSFSVEKNQKIEVVIFDSEGYSNFTNGMKAAKVYFNSRGYVNNGKIDKTLNSGSYYIVFNNIDDYENTKEVKAKIYIEK